MLACVRSAAILGIDGYVVHVEVDVASGLPAFATVGLAQSAVKEGKERVLSALGNAGFEGPARKITINLAPADIKKEGSQVGNMPRYRKIGAVKGFDGDYQVLKVRTCAGFRYRNHPNNHPILRQKRRMRRV